MKLTFDAHRWFVRSSKPESPPLRLSLLQQAIDRIGAQRYLEIGVDDGRIFTNLKVRSRIGVDPVTPPAVVVAACQDRDTRYFQMTSDAFFIHEAEAELRDGVDVVFIDGLHTFGQAYRDCLTALRYLSPGGVVFMHDCLPASAAEETPAESYAAAAALNPSGWNGEWTGDVWKAVALLRAMHLDLEVEVFDCDHGLGLVRSGKNSADLHLAAEAIGLLTYRDLTARKRELLGLRPGAELAQVIETLPRIRRA